MSDREVRHEKAATSRTVIADCLASVWVKGDREPVRDVIQSAKNPQISKQWADDVAALLPESERQTFLEFVGEA